MAIRALRGASSAAPSWASLPVRRTTVETEVLAPTIRMAASCFETGHSARFYTQWSQSACRRFRSQVCEILKDFQTHWALAAYPGQVPVTRDARPSAQSATHG